METLYLILKKVKVDFFSCIRPMAHPKHCEWYLYDSKLHSEEARQREQEAD